MRRTIYFLFCCLWAFPAVAKAPVVVVTLKPLHALTARLMTGISTPRLLIRGHVSPHHYAPRPSEVRTLHQSDLVIWVGDAVEPGLAKTIHSLGPAVRVVTLDAAPGLDLLPARTGGVFTSGNGRPAHALETSPGQEIHVDPHFWLDPRRAQAAAAVITRALVEIDRPNAARYNSNFAKLSSDLAALDRELEGAFAALGATPIFVFHDAYQYLERRYGLNVVGAVTVSADRAPGAKRLASIRARLRREKAPCVLYEPQFKPALVRVLVADSDARQGPLDPLGANIPAGPDHYFSMMRAAARAIKACASGVAPPAPQ